MRPCLLECLNACLIALIHLRCKTDTQIIFSDPFFKPHLPLLVKLLFFSSVVHQTCFTLLSTLPFAIGQVQDAGKYAPLLHSSV